MVLSATAGSVSIASFGTVIGTPAGIASASFIIAFSISTGIMKKIVKNNAEQKRHNKCCHVS